MVVRQVEGPSTLRPEGPDGAVDPRPGPAFPVRRARDRPNAGSAVVYVLQGLAEAAVAGLPTALAAYVALPASIEFRDALGARDDAAAVQAAVVLLQPGLDRTALADAARRLGFGALPTRIAVSGDSVAISVSHGVMDGGPILEYVVWLLSAAAGREARRDAREPAPRPLLAGLRRVGASGVRAWLAERSEPRPPQPHVPIPRDDAGRPRSASTALLLDDALLDRLATHPVDGAATMTMRVASAAIAALARGYRGPGDPPVLVFADLRRTIGGARVLGNFSGVAGRAALRSSSWTPPATAARIAAATTSGAALVGTAAVVAKWHVARALRRRRTYAPTTTPVVVFVPLLAVRTGPPDAVWAGGRPRPILVASLDGGPSGASLTVLSLGATTQLSVWDGTGAFDLDRFERDLRDEVADRERGT